MMAESFKINSKQDLLASTPLSCRTESFGWQKKQQPEKEKQPIGMLNFTKKNSSMFENQLVYQKEIASYEKHQ